MVVSVVIPTLNAEKEIDQLLCGLEAQTKPPAEILVIDSSSEDRTLDRVREHPQVRIRRIPRGDFNHGGTRNQAFLQTRGEAVLFMTQDAIPADERLIENLILALEKYPRAAAAYGRQLPKAEARPAEALIRAFNYPAQSAVREESTSSSDGLRGFYLSNVCAMYRREVYSALGGFETDLRTNEDMLFAAKAIRAGYQIVYAAEARVFHSHNLSLRDQYARNRLQGYELARHRELVENDSPVGSGRAMLRYVTGGLLRKGRLLSWIGFCFDCAARYLGNRAGRREYLKGLKQQERDEKHGRT